jgi:hypothetical protein
VSGIQPCFGHSRLTGEVVESGVTRPASLVADVETGLKNRLFLS